MFLEFFYELRRRKVPVATQEWFTLLRALELGLGEASLDGFYHLARSICVKDLAHYDAFDAAFLAAFKGIESEGLRITEEMMAWLDDPKRLAELTEEQRRMLRELGLDELRALYQRRIEEQRGRHDGGNRWI